MWRRSPPSASPNGSVIIRSAPSTPWPIRASADRDVAFPFWVKPIKSSLSHLGFRIDRLAELAHAQALARQQLPAYVAAFDDMVGLAPGLAAAGLPPATGEGLIAEGLIGGRQCTLEAFFQGGTMRLLGI